MIDCYAAAVLLPVERRADRPKAGVLDGLERSVTGERSALDAGSGVCVVDLQALVGGAEIEDRGPLGLHEGIVIVVKAVAEDERHPRCPQKQRDTYT